MRRPWVGCRRPKIIAKSKRMRQELEVTPTPQAAMTFSITPFSSFSLSARSMWKQASGKKLLTRLGANLTKFATCTFSAITRGGSLFCVLRRIQHHYASAQRLPWTFRLIHSLLLIRNHSGIASFRTFCPTRRWR